MHNDDLCIQICQFDGRTGWCLGCGITVPEIRSWKKLTPFRRSELTRELTRRVARIKKAGS